jgi:hypothetical protein
MQTSHAPNRILIKLNLILLKTITPMYALGNHTHDLDDHLKKQIAHYLMIDMWKVPPLDSATLGRAPKSTE